MCGPKLRVCERDLGWKDIKKNIAGMDKLEVKVGILESAGDHKDSGLTVAAIGAVHEFGSPEEHIPQRSFIRATVDEQRERINSTKKAAAMQVIDLKLSPGQALGAIGLAVQAFVQRKISMGPFVPNAPSTIAAKGSSRPLIDTGQLRRSISYEVVDKGTTEGAI